MRISLEDFEEVESNLTAFQIFSMQNNSSYLSHHLVASCFELLEFELNLETRGVCCVRWRFGTSQSYLPLLSNRLWPFINKKVNMEDSHQTLNESGIHRIPFIMLCISYSICLYLFDQPRTCQNLPFTFAPPVCMRAKLIQSCLTLWDSMDCGPQSMGFFRHEYWSGLPCCPPDLPNPGIEHTSPARAGGFFTTSATWEALAPPTCVQF